MQVEKYVEDFDTLETRRYETGEMLVTPHMTFVTTSSSNSLGMRIDDVRSEEGFSGKGLHSDSDGHFGHGSLIVTFSHPRIKRFEFSFQGYNAHDYGCRCFDQSGSLIKTLKLQSDVAQVVKYDCGEAGFISRLEIDFSSDGQYMAVDRFNIEQEQ
jgi:hypothetical protein